MPPWLDWLDWLKWDCIGAGIIGRILGLWSRFCVSEIRGLSRLTLGMVRGPRASANLTPQPADYACKVPKRTQPSFFGRVGRMAISTLVTVGVWSAITWKPIWTAAGPTGDKILTVVLLFVSAAWPVSLVWIWLSKPQTTIAERRARTSHYSGSNRANAA
jgi:hypothetical protein